MSSSTGSNGETTTSIRTADDVEQGKQSKSICTFNCCTVLLLAIITVLMQFLLIMNLSTSPSNNESSNNYLSIKASKRKYVFNGDQQLQVASDPEVEDNNYHHHHQQQQQQQQKKYSFDKVTTTIDVDNLLSLGKLLLQQGDTIGALASCTSVFTIGLLPSTEGREADRLPHYIHDKELLIQAYVCAGEACLTLYQNMRSMLHDDPQLSSCSTSPSSSTAANRIEEAKSYFELAMDLDPRNPRVRAGLALSLFLIATTTTTTPLANDPNNNSQASKSLLLLEAIQHFITAATYYNRSIDKDATYDDGATATATFMQRSCWYNAALCFIHLHHYSDAIPLLQKSLVRTSTHPKGSDESFIMNTNEILTVITEIEGLKYQLETQSFKLKQLLQRTTASLSPTDFTVLPVHTPIDVNTDDTPDSRIKLPTSGENDLPSTTIINDDHIARYSESDRDLINASNHQGGIDEIDSNISFVASATNMEFPPQSFNKEDDQFLMEDAANETMPATKRNPSSFSEEGWSSDVDLLMNEVVGVDAVTIHNVTEMQQPTLLSENSLQETDTMKDVSSITTLHSMNESDQFLVIPEGVNIQASPEIEGASIVGVSPDLFVNTQVESLPSCDKEMVSDLNVHGDMTASSSTDHQRNVISAAIEDDSISITNTSKIEEVSIEKDMTTMNTSFEMVTLVSSFLEEVPMDAVIDGRSDEIGLLLLPEVDVDLTTTSDDNSAANAIVTKTELAEITNENVVKRDKLNDSMSLLSPTESRRSGMAPQDTIELTTEEDKNATVVSSDTAGAIDAKSDGENPIVETSAEPRQQQLFSYPTVIGNASVDLDVGLLPPADSDDLASDMVLPNTNNATAKPDDKAEYKLDLEGEIEIPVLYSATPRSTEEVNLTALEESYMKVADSLLSKSNFLRASKQLQKVIKSSPNYLPARLGYANALESLAGDKKKKNNNVKDITLAYVEAAKVALKQDPRINYVSSVAGDGGLAEAFLNHALMVAEGAPKKDRLEIYNSLISAAHTGSVAAEAYYHLGMELLSALSESSSTNVDYHPAIHAFRTANQYASLITGNEWKGHGKSLVQLAKIGLLASQDKMQVQTILQRAISCSLDEATKSEALLLLEKTKSVSDGMVSDPVQKDNKKNQRSDIFSQSSTRDKDVTSVVKLKSSLKAPGLGGMWVRGIEKPAENT